MTIANETTIDTHIYNAERVYRDAEDELELRKKPTKKRKAELRLLMDIADAAIRHLDAMRFAITRYKRLDGIRDTYLKVANSKDPLAKARFDLIDTKLELVIAEMKVLGYQLYWIYDNHRVFTNGISKFTLELPIDYYAYEEEREEEGYYEF